MNDQKIDDFLAVAMGAVFALLLVMATTQTYRHFMLHH